MANCARDDLRKATEQQKSQYKRGLSFIIYLIVVLTMTTLTFLNPFFMKGQLRTDSNQAVIVRQVNKHFDTLASEIGANQNGSANLLTTKQTQPIADHIIDYTLGTFGFKFSNLHLANQILLDIDRNIDQESSSDAQLVRQKLKKQRNNAPYEVADAFSLQTVTIGGNVAFIFLLINLVLLVMAAISIRSLVSEMKTTMSSKALTHEVTASCMWTGFWVILIAGILALVPIVINVDQVAVFGYILEISSSIFLDFVIVGVILYVFSAIVWEFTSSAD